MYKKIHIDQRGYLPDMVKKATFVCNTAPSFTVTKSDGTKVLTTIAEEHYENASSNETVYVGDFSSVTEPGLYFLISEECGESDTFRIAPDLYDDVFQSAVKFFYLQRCGCDLPKEKAGLFAHPACHTSPAIVYGTSEHIDANGGWHDAGDYGRYIVPAAMTVAQLLLAAEYNPTLAAKYANPSGSTLPDLLDEVKYELDWMLKLQRSDGCVYHKSTCHSFCGFIMPEDETGEIVISPVSYTATADFAAVMALAVRFYRPYDSDYADVLSSAARRAYDAMKQMDPQELFKNPEGVATGWYSDRNSLDERYWAAAELYRLFGEERYHEDFKALAAEGILHGYGWMEMGSYGNLAYQNTSFPTDASLLARIKEAIVSQAKNLLVNVKSDGYGVSLSPRDYVWGSNLAVANNGILLMDAYRLTKDETFRKAAAEQLHYLLGRNPMGTCYLSGFGDSPMRHPHHRPSGYLGKAMPGMLSGGPSGWRADPVVKAVIPENTPPAKSYADMTGSYSTNEVAIYWNSAFVMLLAVVL